MGVGTGVRRRGRSGLPSAVVYVSAMLTFRCLTGVAIVPGDDVNPTSLSETSGMTCLAFLPS